MKDFFEGLLKFFIIWMTLTFGIVIICKCCIPRATITLGDNGNEVVYHNVDPADVSKYINQIN